MNPAGFARAVAETLHAPEPPEIIEIPADCVCLACRAHLVLDLIPMCGDCGMAACPVCLKHGHVAPFGTWTVPPQLAASVRASVWGRGN